MLHIEKTSPDLDVAVLLSCQQLKVKLVKGTLVFNGKY